MGVTGEVIANVDLTNPTKTFTLIVEPTAFHKIELIWSLNIEALSPIFVLVKFDALELLNVNLSLDIKTPTKTAMMKVESLGKQLATINIVADLFAPTKNLVAHVTLMELPILDIDV